MSSPKLYLLDYGAGNVRSLANSLTHLGYTFEWIASSDDFAKADVRLLLYSVLSACLIFAVEIDISGCRRVRNGHRKPYLQGPS
jgi:hypothetical protein